MALSRDLQIKRQDGVLEAFPVYQSVKIYKGSLVCVGGSTGYAIPGADASGNIFVGVAAEYVDNSSGSSGDKWVTVYRTGTFELPASSITQAMVGDLMYVVHDGAFDETSPGNSIVCGRLVRYISTTRGVLDISFGVAVGTTFAATAISVADTADYFDVASTTVEKVLAEIGAELAVYNVGYVTPFFLANEDGTALTKFTAGATPGYQQLSNKEVVLTWDGNAGPTLATAAFLLPPDLDGTADVEVHWLAAMAGTTDTPNMYHECYIGVGDTDCAGTDDVVDGGVTLTEYSAVIAAANVPDTGPANLSVVFGPTGTMTTDELRVYAMWLEYAKVTS